MSRLNQKFKRFFKVGEATKSTVDLLKMFIIPFSKGYDPNAAVDDSVAAFFNTEHRSIVTIKALKAFRMPGLYQRVGGVPTTRVSNREVPEGAKMIVVVDRKDQTAKIDVTIENKDLTFLLSRAEFIFVSDRVERI